MMRTGVELRARLFAVGLMLAATCEAGVVSAQSDDQAKRDAARGLATQGLRAMQEGRYSDTIEMFRGAEALVHAPPHYLYVARASEKLGKLYKLARRT